MQSSRIPSPSRSQGAKSTPRRYRPRSSRSVGSPARSTTSLKLSTVIQMESLVVSPMPSRRSVLMDTTLVHTPARKSWWKKLDENSREIMDVLNSQEPTEPNNAIVEYIEVDVLSQEKKNYTLDMPESSDGESITSIVIPQRKLFKQKEKHPQDKFGQIIDGRESLAQLHKSQADVEKSLNVNPKNLFNLGTTQRRKPIFPSALLNVSVNKTITNKTKEMVTNEDHGQVKSLFGNRAGTKRKNMFADFIASESEDDVSEIQPKIFGFQKKLEQKRRASLQIRNGREPSPPSITDIEMDDWELLPSSTMVDHQLEDGLKTTPSKRTRLSKISDATNYVNPLNTSKNKSKLLNSKNKSTHSKFKEIEVDKLIEPQTSGDELDADNSENQRKINTRDKNISHEIHLQEQTLKLHKHNKSDKITRTTQNTTAKSDEFNNSANSKLHKTKTNVKSISKIDQALESDDEDDFTLEYENDDNDEQNVQGIKENETIVQNENHKQQSIAPNSSISKQQKNRISKSQSVVHNESEKVNENEDVESQPQNTSFKMSQRDQSKLNVNVSHNKKQNVDISNYQTQSQVHSNDKKNNSKINIKNRSALEVHDSSKITEMQNVNKNISRKEFTENKDCDNDKKDIVDEQNDEEANISGDSNTQSHNEIEAVKNISEAAVSVEEDPQNESEEASNDEVEIEKNTESENDSDNEDDEDIPDQENEDQEMYNQGEAQTQKNNSNVKLNQSKDVQGENLNEADEIMDSDDNQSDKNNRTSHRKKGLNITKDANEENRNNEHTVPSPEVPVLQNKMNEMESFTVKGRNTSARKTKSMIKSLNIRPSLAPVREISDLTDGTRNSSAEGSGWDSHRTTRKTLRKTFGKDFSMRKSLRTLVMEKSTKRQTEFTETNAEISNFPQANSTELPNPEFYMVEDEVDGGQESDVLEPQDAEPLDMDDDKPDDVQATVEQEEQNTEADMGEVEAEDDVQESSDEDPQNSEPSNMDENDDVQDSDVQKPQNSDLQESAVEESRNTEAEMDEDQDEDDNNGQESEIEESQNTEAEINEDGDDNNGQESEIEESQNTEAEIDEDQDDDNNEQESEIEESQNTEAEMDEDEDNNVVQESELEESQNNEDEADDDVQDSDVQEPQENEVSDMDEDEANGDVRASEVHETQDSEHFNADKINNSYDQEPHHTESFDMNEAEADDDVQESNVHKQLETKRETPIKKRQTTLVMYLQNVKNKNIERKKQLEHDIRSTLKAPTRDVFNPFKVPAVPKQRRTKAQSKPKPKPRAAMFPTDLLPAELLADMKYKPPKRYRPPNASWITKRLYKFLETKLEPKYDYKARVRSEKLVEKLYEFTKIIRRHTAAPQETVTELKHEMARLGIVATHFEFNQFFHDYMPREVRLKVVPDAFNNIPEPKHGIFSNILR